MSDVTFADNAWLRHPLVAGQWFYTLPPKLIQHLGTELRGDNWDLSRIETPASHAAERFGQCVGFRDGSPINDHYLRPVPPLTSIAPFVSETMDEWKSARRVSEQTTFEAIEAAVEILERLRGPETAYLGWLFTNRSFLAEFQELLRSEPPGGESAPAFPVNLVAGPVPVASSPDSEFGIVPVSSDEQAQQIEATRDFCIRWRLARVVGRRTVVPLSIQVPTPLPQRSAENAESSGVLLYIPDIAPLPGRDELRALVESARTATNANAPLLREWFELVEADTQGRKALVKYALWYPYQHYLRVLFERHGHQLNGSLNAVDRAFSKFFECTVKSVKRHRREISERLEPNWWLPQVRD
jgi:hypothetical protein